MNKINISDALRHMMKMHATELAGLKGQPPQGKCCDCRREIPATEISVKCDKCSNTFVCVNCIDRHDHCHDELAQGLRLA